MKKYIYPLILLALCSCIQESNELVEKSQKENRLHVTLQADFQPATKVTFDDGGQLVWEGLDSVALIVGDDASRGVRPDNHSLVARLDAAGEGIFEGIVDIGSFNRDDIQGAVYPYNSEHHYRVSEVEGVLTHAIGMMVGGKRDAAGDFMQVQKKDNVLHGENIVLYSQFTPDYTKDHPNNDFEYGGGYLFDNQIFKWGSAVLRFNIFGKHEVMDETETIKSVVLAPRMPGLAGVHYVVEETGEFVVYDDALLASATNTVAVSLEEGVTVADKTQENGVKIFMSLLPAGDVVFPEGAELTVYTDKWFYYVPLGGIEVDLACGIVRKVALDMSTAVSPEKTYYCADGTEEWTMTLPEKFESLAVKGGIRADILLQIRDAVRAQNSAVSLDLSAAVYEGVEFPDIFAGESEASTDESLKSIKFPSNITKIAAKAFMYCDALESVDLSLISEIGSNAFRYSGLRTVNVPSNVTMIGRDAFGDLSDVDSIYYNPSIDWASITDTDMRRSHMANRNNVSEWNDRSNPLTVTIGPAVTEIPAYCFDTNAKLTNLIIEGDNLKFINQWAIRAYNIERIEFKGAEPSVESGSLGSNFAMKLDEYEGSIIVPEGKLAEFADNAAIQTILATGKYMIREAGAEGQKSVVLYSIEGEHWYEALPSTFEKLYVKTEGENVLTISELYMIKSAMKAQNQPVALDFSQATYMSDTFPAIFNGTSDAAPATYIKSVRFPMNVTDIAGSAFRYCESLESVDLTGIVSIGANAFSSSGLLSVDVPSSVTEIGTYAFAYMPKLQYVYYNASITDQYSPGSTSFHVFCNRDTKYGQTGSNMDWNNDQTPQKFVVGPAVGILGRHVFDTNAMLTELVVEGDDLNFGSEWAIRAYNLRRIEFTAGPPSASGKSPGGDFALNIGEGEGVIIVPDDRYSDFEGNANIQNILSFGKHVLKKKSEEYIL